MVTKEISAYEQQAIDFLAQTQTTISIVRTTENQCAGWCDGKHIHGNEYLVTFQRGRQSVSIKFWNSKHYKDKRISPTAYDVLACISGDMYVKDMLFEDFCSDYGYSDDSIKAKETYTAVVRQAIQLSKIWSDSREIELLQEIQ